MFRYSHLHSTMFLLIRLPESMNRALQSSFTFHNVSINTNTRIYMQNQRLPFTFHNVSINTKIRKPLILLHGNHLHSTMFLLIRHHSQRC